MTEPTAPVPISERPRDYLRESRPVVGLTPETITSDQVPRWERDRLPIVEAAGDIVWVAGVRRAATAPITAACASAGNALT